MTAIKLSPAEKTGQVILHFLMILLTILCIAPILLTFMASISSEASVSTYGYRFWPKEFSLEAYRLVFSTPAVVKAYGVTIAVTVVGTVLSLTLCSLAGYAMSVSKVKYRNALSMFFYIPMVFSAGLVPWYLVITQVLQLKNSFFALIVPSLVSPFNLFLMRNYFKTIPASLVESAEIDGAGALHTFLRIILPLSTPIISTAALFISLTYWNGWSEALWFIDNPDLYPLQYMLYRIQSQIELVKQSGSLGAAPLPSQTFRVATLFVTVGPIILVYPFVQRYFVKGIMIGAVKG